MIEKTFEEKKAFVMARYKALIERPNEQDPTWYNGIYERYLYPAITNEHLPREWVYDFNPETNPLFQERLGVNAAFNASAMEWNGKIVMVVRVEGNDRKSIFAIAESDNGVDQFRFWDEPVVIPETDNPATNLYDMRLTAHEDGWIYGVFCAERLDPNASAGDLSSAVAQCGIARTKDLKTWERLPDLISHASQQRNVVLHPEFIDRKHAFYTRPQDDFIKAGSGGGIGWALADDITKPELGNEIIIDPRHYHTIKEVKNGMGPTPIKTDKGWLHIDHAVRGTAAGMRYVLYAYLCDKDYPWIVTHRPGGHLIAPRGKERVGDVSNVLFSNGMVARADGTVYIYYASSDTRMHVAVSTVDHLLDYVMNTPEDGMRSYVCTRQRIELIRRNAQLSTSIA